MSWHHSMWHHQTVNDDVTSKFKNLTLPELSEQQVEIQEMLDSGKASVDSEFWEAVLKELHIFKVCLTYCTWSSYKVYDPHSTLYPSWVYRLTMMTCMWLSYHILSYPIYDAWHLVSSICSLVPSSFCDLAGYSAFWFTRPWPSFVKYTRPCSRPNSRS